MANIRVDVNNAPYMGQPISFRSPTGCASVTGLIVYYPTINGISSHVFQFTDAHGNDVGGKNLFASGVLVKVILDTEMSKAYIQNADTNSYLESRFESLGTKEHTHNASDITGGTFGGQVAAKADAQNPAISLLRNSKASTIDITAGTTALANGEMYLVYE